MLLDVRSVGHSCARTHNRPFYSREPERYYIYYPVHTNAFSLSWKTHRSFRVHTTVLKRFRLSKLIWCVCVFVLIRFQERFKIDAFLMKTLSVLVSTEGLNASKCTRIQTCVLGIRFRVNVRLKLTLFWYKTLLVFSSLSLLTPRPLPAPFDSPHFLFSFRVSPWRFREQNILAPDETACTAGQVCGVAM